MPLNIDIISNKVLYSVYQPFRNLPIDNIDIMNALCQEMILLSYSFITSRIFICLILVGWLVVLRINVDLAIFQPYLDLEAGDNQSLKIQVARPGIEPGSSCSASQELNHSATAAPSNFRNVCQKIVNLHYLSKNRRIHAIKKNDVN